jgi:RNA-directed DNA polymerase
VRFPGATHLVVGFEHRADAERFLVELQERMAEFGLELHPEKTRLIEFGRFASVDRRQRGEGEPESFTFLGFTHRCGTNRNGSYVVWRHTARQRLEAKLQQIKQTLRERMHEPVPLVGIWLGRVVRGFYQYHAVPGNWANLARFRQRIGWYWQHTLARRSQTGRISAERISRLCDQYLPRPRLLHPYPDVRFDATHPR